jgi:glycosyltransferase involved in cell wall biosynthesis
MRYSRVLMTTYPTAFLHRGGGEVELLGIFESLKQQGVVVDLYGAHSLPLSRYDVVFHYSIVHSGLELVREAKRAGKKLVLMPSVWWTAQPSELDVNSANEFFVLADEIVFKSKSEFDNVSQYIAIDAKKVSFCPWGIDSCYGMVADKNLFKDAHNLKQYVLWTGIIEESKNQLTAIRALKDLEIPLVFIGEYRDRKYYEACVKTAPAHFQFLPSLQPKSEMLRSAVQNCSVFLEVSMEPAGLSALEAGLAGVPLVLANNRWSEEHLGEHATLVDPLSVDEISNAVNQAINSDPSADLKSNIRTKHCLPQSIAPLIQSLKI